MFTFGETELLQTNCRQHTLKGEMMKVPRALTLEEIKKDYPEQYIAALEAAMKENDEQIAILTEKLKLEYDRGFDDGETKQAILELQGRDKFLAELKSEDKEKIAALTAEITEYEKWGSEVRKESASLHEWDDRLTAENKRLREALEKLSRLGNEPMLGNSIGNKIAQAALKPEGKEKDDEILSRQLS
jgi:regulator of replication initiation timing